MMIRSAELAAIKAGTIDLAFRRCARPRVVSVALIDAHPTVRAPELAAIHGVGPIAIARLRDALEDQGGGRAG